MTDDFFDQDCPQRGVETCPMCSSRIPNDFVGEITSAAATLSEPMSAKQFLNVLALCHGASDSGQQ